MKAGFQKNLTPVVRRQDGTLGLAAEIQLEKSHSSWLDSIFNGVKGTHHQSPVRTRKASSEAYAGLLESVTACRPCMGLLRISGIDATDK